VAVAHPGAGVVHIPSTTVADSWMNRCDSGRSSWIRPLPARGRGPYGSSCPKGPTQRTGEARSDPRSAAGPAGRAARFGRQDRRSGTRLAAITSRLAVPKSTPFVVGSFGRSCVPGGRERRLRRSRTRSTLRRCRRPQRDEPEPGRLSGRRLSRRRDSSRQPEQVRVRRSGRRLPARSRSRFGRPLQLRLRVHQRNAGG
jgi:hypothetical protein